MRKKIFQWLGREFVALSCGGKRGSTATEEAQGIFRRFDGELREIGLSLENTLENNTPIRGSLNRFRSGTGKAIASLFDNYSV